MPDYVPSGLFGAADVSLQQSAEDPVLFSENQLGSGSTGVSLDSPFIGGDVPMIGDIPALRDAAKQGQRSGLTDVETYYREGTVQGIPVAPEYVNLPFRNTDNINDIFRVDRKMHSALFLISYEPGETAIGKLKDTLNAYSQIRQKACDGSVIIVSEDKTYDPVLHGYNVLLVYEEDTMVLRPEFRGQFKKQEAQPVFPEALDTESTTKHA